MAEYIDRERINLFGFFDAGDYNQAMRCINSMPTEDVVAREEYDYLQSLKELLKRQIESAWIRIDELDKLNGEMRKKIDRAIKEIELLKLHQSKYITEDGKVCIDSEEVLKILKEI